MPWTQRRMSVTLTGSLSWPPPTGRPTWRSTSLVSSTTASPTCVIDQPPVLVLPDVRVSNDPTPGDPARARRPSSRASPPPIPIVPGCIPMDLPVMPPVEPMLAKLARQLPPDGGVLYEPKWDGFRTIVFRDGDEVELGSRNERPMTRYFPEVLDSVRASLPRRCVVDGELVI